MKVGGTRLSRKLSPISVTEGIMIKPRLRRLASWPPDYGAKMAGVACTGFGLTAQAVETVRLKKRENKLRKTLARIDQIARDRDLARFWWDFLSIWTTVRARGQGWRETPSLTVAQRTGIAVEMYERQ